MVDHLGQMLAETIEQLFARQPELRRERLDLVRPERGAEVGPREIGRFGPVPTQELAASP